MRSRPRIPSPCPRRRSQKMLRTWNNFDFARDIPKKCQVLNILRDAYPRCYGPFFRATSQKYSDDHRGPGGRPNKFEKLLEKTVRSTVPPRKASRRMLRTWYFLRTSRAKSQIYQVLNILCDRLLGQGDGILGRLLIIFRPPGCFGPKSFLRKTCGKFEVPIC